jgi:response regulator NasT
MNQARRVAVADDESDIREYFRKVLPLLGYEVVAAARDGRELVEQCRAVRPDLVISDVKMPDLDGIEATAQICRETPVPVILVSACPDLEPAGSTETAHVLGYLVKPIRQADLRAMIASALQRFEQSQVSSRAAGRQ